MRGFCVLSLVLLASLFSFQAVRAETATVGQPYMHQIIQGPNGGCGYIAFGLPPGVSYDPNSGLISGIPTQAGDFTVTASSTNCDEDDVPPDGDGDEDSPEVFVLTVIDSNGPQFTSALAVTGCVGQPFTYTITATSQNPGPIVYSAVGDQSELVFDGVDTISGTPTVAGSYSFSLTAMDSVTFNVAVLDITIDDVPEINDPGQLSAIDHQFFSTQLTTVNNDAMTFSALTALPPGLTLSASGLISGTPNVMNCQAEDYTVTVVAANSCGQGNSLDIVISVPDNNPVVTPASLTLCEDVAMTPFQVQATSPRGAILSFDAAELPEGLEIDPESGLIFGTPSDDGLTEVTITATDGTCTGEATLTIVVFKAPSISGPSKSTAIVGQPYMYQIMSDPPDVTYAAAGLPASLTLNTVSGVISGTPLDTDEGTYKVTLTIVAGCGFDNMVLTLTVKSTAPLCPAITSAAFAPGVVGAAFNYQILATNGPITAFTASPLPTGLSVNAAGLISGTPAAPSETDVVISATNSSCTGSATLHISIVPSGAPAITSPLTLAGVLATPLAPTYQIVATNTPLSYDASGLPAGLSVNAGTGIISGTPLVAGDFNAIITATNALGSGSAVLVVTISAPPVISSKLADTTVFDTSYTYQIAATNSPTSFGAIGLPAGLSVDTGLGTITGFTTELGLFPVVISATNATGTGSAVLMLTVTSAGSAFTDPPVITASTATGAVGVSFFYQINAQNYPTNYDAAGLPPGLSVNTTTGGISGTPTLAGVFYVTLGATNINGSSTASLIVTIVQSAPLINSPLTANASVGAPFNYQITASNNPASFDALPLPQGLAINHITGVISGTVFSAGTPNIMIIAMNAAGKGTATLVLTITGAPPAIVSSLTGVATEGQPYSYLILGTNNPTSFNATGLPLGLNVDTTTGFINGTPGAGTAGVSTITLSATNSVNTTNATLVLTINPTAASLKPVITSAKAAHGVEGAVFSYQIVAPATNGPIISYNAAPLPGSLTINTGTGAITGTLPNAVQTLNVVLTATNTNGSSTAGLTISVLPAIPVISSATVLNATAGVRTSYQIVASNAPTDYSVSSLPPGLAIDRTTGLISGIPTAAGNFVVTLAATNAGGLGTLTLGIFVAPPAGPVVITSGPSITANIGVAIAPYQITATNTPTIFTASPLPTGISVSAAGLISGTPTASGNFMFHVTASDGITTAASLVSLTVIPDAPVVTSASTANGTQGVPFSYTTTAMNSPTFFTTLTTLPAGLGINVQTGVISGTPTVNGTFDLTLMVMNGGGQTPFDFTLIIAAPATTPTPPNPPPAAPPASTPLISSPLTASATQGAAFAYTITASGNGTQTFGAVNLPPGLSLAGSVISGTPIQKGVAQVFLTVTNEAGSDTELLVITIAGSGGPAESPPVFASSPTAAPNPALVGASVALNAAASDADGDVLAYSWNFGDGTSGFGASVNKVYAAAGVYQVTVTVTDGVSSVQSTVDVGVNSAPPTGSFTVSGATIMLNFQTSGKDSLMLKGTLSLPAGTKLAGAGFELDIGSHQTKSTLNAKGMSADKSFKLSKTGFTFSLKNTSLGAPLAPLGFTKTTKATSITFPVLITVAGSSYEANVSVKYTIKSSKKTGPSTGTGKK